LEPTFLKAYEYVDEMLVGQFKKWRHLHKFRNIDGKQTEIIDEIEFELPYGILGKLFEGYALLFWNMQGSKSSWHIITNH
jgi:ligand-binding SRPBCC domain-containing protein